MATTHSLDFAGAAWRLGLTLLLVVVNGFFVAAEFSLVTVRRARITELAEKGGFTARMARGILDHLDQYLSACQLGITLASLVLGALGEPAVAALISFSLELVGVDVDPSSAPLRWLSLIVAFTTITVLHMTLGEQAPKMWALRNAQPAALAIATPLRIFTVVLWPVITFINGISNAMLRLVGLEPQHGHDVIPTRAELRQALNLSAEAGHISEQGRELAHNVLRAVDMQVRHILVPRADVVILSLHRGVEDNLQLMRESGHSRFPLCDGDLDNIIGFVHTKHLFERGEAALTNEILKSLARPPQITVDVRPLGPFISQLQRSGNHVAMVVGEHGSALGLAFLEDAIEEIVGPIADEFDDAGPIWTELESGDLEVNGTVPLPDAMDKLDLVIPQPLGSSLGGHLMGLLGRLPRKGEQLRLGGYDVTVLTLARGRSVGRVRLCRRPDSDQPTAPAPLGEGTP